MLEVDCELPSGSNIRKKVYFYYSQLHLMPESLKWDSIPPSVPDSNGYYPIPTPGKTKFI